MELTSWGPWVLSVVGAVGLWGSGRYQPWGWAVLVFSEALWIAYAFLTAQWGFIPFCFVWAGLYARGWRLSRKAA